MHNRNHQSEAVQHHFVAPGIRLSAAGSHTAYLILLCVPQYVLSRLTRREDRNMRSDIHCTYIHTYSANSLRPRNGGEKDNRSGQRDSEGVQR